MMIVMKEEATPEQIASVVKRVESVGAHAHVSEGDVLTVIGAIGDRERIANLDLDGATASTASYPSPSRTSSRRRSSGMGSRPWWRSTGARSAEATSP